MNVTINGKPVALTPECAEEELNRIFRELYEQNEIVQEVMLDGTIYRDDYKERIMQNLDTIQELQIRTVNGEAVAAELETELKDYLPRLIKAFDSISELLYGEMTNEVWNMVGQLLEGIGWVAQAAEHLKTQAERTGDAIRTDWWQRFLSGLAGQLADLERQLAQSEFTAAGDLLKYEMPETFETLLGRLASGEPA